MITCKYQLYHLKKVGSFFFWVNEKNGELYEIVEELNWVVRKLHVKITITSQNQIQKISEHNIN